MDVHYKRITSHEHVNPSVMRTKSDFKKICFFYNSEKKNEEGSVLNSVKCRCHVLNRHRGLDSVSSRKYTQAQGHRESEIQETHVETIQLAV